MCCGSDKGQSHPDHTKSPLTGWNNKHPLEKLKSVEKRINRGRVFSPLSILLHFPERVPVCRFWTNFTLNLGVGLVREVSCQSRTVS